MEKDISVNMIRTTSMRSRHSRSISSSTTWNLYSELTSSLLRFFFRDFKFLLFHIMSQGLAIGITAMGIILIIFLIITYRRRFFISFWLMKQRRKYKHLEKKEMTDLYDVFISYSQEQHDWVTQQLIPELEEKNPKLRVCIHERDFKVGVTVTENIVDCIYRSGKFLMVLSDGFIKSQWCQFESHVAQHKLRGGDRWDRSKS